ncbi:sigma factor-like helix-turn-helix DNA-binding protein [Streptomyces sp. NPDC054904]
MTSPISSNTPRNALTRHVAAGVCLQLGYSAFCLRNQDRYIRYARARSLDASRARAVVESVLDALVETWPAVISSDRPASIVWDMLATRVAAAAREARERRTGRGRDTLHSALPDQQADVVVLRYRLCLTAAETADLMGLDEPEVTVQLRWGLSHLTNRG